MQRTSTTPRDMLLAVDIGLTSTKAAAFDVDGRLCGIERRPTPTRSGANGAHEIDLDSMWVTVATTIRAIVDRIDAPFAGVSVTAFGNGLFPLDRSGKPVGCGMTSSDTRATLAVDRLNADDSAHIRTLTSIEPWSGQPLAQLRWMLETDPDRAFSIHSIVSAKDWIRYRLTGELSTDWTDTSAAGLADGMRGLELSDAWGLHRLSAQPASVLSATDLGGTVSQQAAGETGLAQGTPVAVGMFDCAATILGGGGSAQGDVTLIAGTWAITGVVTTSAPVPEVRPFVRIPWVSPSLALRLESAPAAGAGLEWLDALIGKTHVDRDLNSELSEDEIESEMGDLQFTPFIAGLPASPQVGAVFRGIRLHHRPPHLRRAVLEGIAEVYRYQLSAIDSTPSEIRLVGGLTRITGWPQLVATATGTSVLIPRSEDELGARGAALLAGVAAGLWSHPDQSPASWRVPYDVVRPSPRTQRSEVLARAFDHDLRDALSARPPQKPE